ncbi:MAG: DNA cytosine methyltransferase [Alphaproteobacteria bacterium]|nr:DNA cytosine methyltransferase [Alphaproteobacteria bacterium]
MLHLRELRRRRGLTQARLAELSGVPIRGLRLWERGLESPPPQALAALAAALRVPTEALAEAQAAFAERHLIGEGYATAKGARADATIPRRAPTPPGHMRVLDLFCGAGGFSYGLAQTGAFAVTAGVDLLGDRLRTFAANHPHAAALPGDIRAARASALEELAEGPDVIIGGPPCQGFSSLRPFRSLVADDPRNSLFEAFALIVGALKPRWFLLENVVGLLQHRRHAAFQRLLQGFAEQGFRLDWRVLNAAHYGLPQNRERVIVVGSREGKAFRWPTPTHASEHRSMASSHAQFVPQPEGLPPALSVMEAIDDLPALSAGEEALRYTRPPRTPYQAALRGGCEALTLHRATAHSPHMLDIIRQAGASRAELPEGLTRSGFSSSYSRLDADQPSVTLTVNFVHPSSNKCIHPTQDRALTPREGARLQSFPDDFRFHGGRSKVVKQIGNAVPPLLGRVLGEALLASMG